MYMDLLVWLESTAVAQAIKTSIWMYPAFETGHYIGLSFLVGGIMLIDLRVLGVARSLPLRSMIGLLPWVWAGFIINMVTGGLLFTYGATSFGTNGAFLVKMSFMVLAGLNAFAFQLTTTRASYDWVTEDRPPLAVKVFATLSFLLWLCVVTTGRWMAYL
jgi:hypothetical protein